MSQYQIAVVIGSLRRDSFNRKLATAVVKLAPSEFSFKQVQIGDLPLYSQDDDARQADAVKRLKGEITGSRGLLFVMAEYNRSIPGVLKNAIDHASRPYGPAPGKGDSGARRRSCLHWTMAAWSRGWSTSLSARMQLISPAGRWWTSRPTVSSRYHPPVTLRR